MRRKRDCRVDLMRCNTGESPGIGTGAGLLPRFVACPNLPHHAAGRALMVTVLRPRALAR